MQQADIVHRVRASVFAREAEWRVSDGRLFWKDVGEVGKGVPASGESGIIALDQIASVRLTREPTRGGERLFCRLKTREGAVALIGSAHQAGVLRAQDRSNSYRALIRAILADAAKPGVNERTPLFLTGATPFVWWGVVVGLALLLGSMGALFVLVGGEMFTTRLFVGVALVALGAPNLVRWLMSNRPGTFDPANPPL
ncbi:MAG: hypothetical protein K2Y29_03160 [Beijerinckiaceae bacterium]|nr:hypothetical protein [Beijerinckiaceae bacterium]